MASNIIRRVWFGRGVVAKASAPARTGYNKVAGSLVTLRFDEPLRAAPVATQFTATVDGVARTVSGVTTSGADCRITLAAPVVSGGQRVVITYAKNGTPAQNLADVGGTAAADFVTTIVA
jgi:uncharacterized repeat protein (TIGR02059 family)